MDIVLISVVSLVVAGLTFFSGFGLGTLLLPAFALFFPVEIAIAATAIVHLANNIFKVVLVGKDAERKITIRFAVPAAAGALIGAWLLNYFSVLSPITVYTIGGKEFFITPIKFLVALLMMIFALMELIPAFNKLSINKKYIPLGGVLSGFFGGLSGHQGALRTAFLLRAGLEKKSFIGTMVVSAVVVDVVRLLVYGYSFVEKDSSLMEHEGITTLLIFGSIFAFIGSYFGKYLVEKITFVTIQIFIAVLLIIFSLALGLGIV